MVLITFGEEVTKILRNLCLHFARQDGRDRKKWRENHIAKVTKIPINQRTKTWDERNKSLQNCRGLKITRHFNGKKGNKKYKLESLICICVGLNSSIHYTFGFGRSMSGLNMGFSKRLVRIGVFFEVI